MVLVLACTAEVLHAAYTYLTMQGGLALQERLVMWGKEQGMAFDEVTIRKGPVGRGLFLRRSAKQGKTLYEVPETMWISEATLSNKSGFRTVIADSGFQQMIKKHIAPDKVPCHGLSKRLQLTILVVSSTHTHTSSCLPLSSL